MADLLVYFPDEEAVLDFERVRPRSRANSFRDVSTVTPSEPNTYLDIWVSENNGAQSHFPYSTPRAPRHVIRDLPSFAANRPKRASLFLVPTDINLAPPHSSTDYTLTECQTGDADRSSLNLPGVYLMCISVYACMYLCVNVCKCIYIYICVCVWSMYLSVTSVTPLRVSQAHQTHRSSCQPRAAHRSRRILAAASTPSGQTESPRAVRPWPACCRNPWQWTRMICRSFFHILLLEETHTSTRSRRSEPGRHAELCFQAGLPPGHQHVGEPDVRAGSRRLDSDGTSRCRHASPG
jgi:hypothetical protein